MEQFILPLVLNIPLGCSESESCELFWCLNCCGCKCPNISWMSPPWGTWCQGSPSCWLLLSFYVFNFVPWSPFWASPVLGVVWQLPTLSDTPWTSGAGLEKPGEICRVLTAREKLRWLWELHLCNKWIESLWDLQFKFWVFPLSICFKGICVHS